jgi:hypothetical protein
MSNIKAALSVRKDDFYATCSQAVSALLAIEPDLPHALYEPACGDGAIVIPLRLAGHSVIASDLVDRGCPDSYSRIDFLLPGVPAVSYQGIVTNPPFKLADEFLARALERAPYVAFLLRINFLAGAARRPMHESAPLARVHISSRRLPMMHRGDYDGPVSGSQMDYAWFVWDKAHAGSPQIKWFDWKEFA